MNELQVTKMISGVRCYEREGVAYLNAEDVAKGLGFTQEKNNVLYVKWERVNQYLRDFKFSPEVGKDDFIPENIFYRLAMKAKNDVAETFQAKVADEIIPAIRRTGGYIANSDMMVETYFGDMGEEHKAAIKVLFDGLEEKQKKIVLLNRENDLLAQKTLEWTSRATINALIRAYGAVVGFETGWRDFKKELLYRHSINLNQRITNYLNETGKKTKPKTLDMLSDDELSAALATAVALCREKNVDIDSIIDRKAS